MIPREMIKNYVLGFMFDLNKDHVWLIRKDHPEWQKGKLNGIGGHIEKGETPYQAMVREFREEAGLIGIKWSYFGKMYSEGNNPFNLYLYKAFSDEIPRSMTQETIFRVELANFFMGKSHVIPNLQWLIPMALDESNALSFSITY